MDLQQLLDLAQLHLVIGENLEDALLIGDARFAVLEVEARRDLAGKAGERVVDLGEIETGYDIEARHVKPLGTRPNGSL